MTAQLHQAAQTYLTRRSLWAVGAFALLSFGVSLAISSLEPNDPIGALPLVGLAAAVTGFAVGSHAKWQFCTPRARLLPGFNRPHIAMLLALLVACCGVYPLVVAIAARWSLLGALACSIAGTAAAIWATHRPHALTIAPAFVIFLSFGVRPTINFYVLPTHAPTVAAAHLAILVVAWGSIAYWMRRLCVMGEEDPDYLIPDFAQDGPWGRRARIQATCASGRHAVPGTWPALLADRWRVSLANVRATTIAARQRLLGDGPAPVSPAIRAAGMAATSLGMLGIAALIGIAFDMGFGLDTRENTPMLGIIVLMTSATGGSLLLARRARMAEELLLPLRRQDFFNGLFAASVRNALGAWIPTQLAMIAYIAIFMPNRFSPGFLAAVTALSLGVHLFLLGANTSIARANSTNVRLLGPTIALVAATFALIVGINHLPPPVLTAAEREQRVQQELAEKAAEFDAPLPPETKREILDLARRNVNRRLDGPPAGSSITWICAAALTAAGLAAYVDGRKRWLVLELG